MWPFKKTKQTRGYRAFIFKGSIGWQWNIEANNGELVARSGHGYKRRYNCRQSLEQFLSKASATVIMDYEA